MRTVPTATHHRKRVAVIAFTLCILLSSVLALYTYNTVTSGSSQIVHRRYYGATQDQKNPAQLPVVGVPHVEDVPSQSITPNHSSKRHLVASSQVRRIPTTMPSSAECNSSVAPPKLILLWTSFFGSWSYFSSLSFKNCPNCTNCNVTADRGRLPESDAIIFHCRDMTLADLPYLRLPHQRWVFYCLESPVYSDFPGMDLMHNMFNLTMTYRRDSDIETPYGRLQMVTPKRTWDSMSLSDVWRKKTRSVFWMTSHCPTHGNRDNYVRHLKKYIDVDIYGDCGTKVCAKNNTHECLQKSAEKYKFYLAFENSICKDYVTEKFFRTFKYNIIPVVFGGADYANYAPRGSYIDALSFRSPKHLASFLTGVGSNFALYSAYFRWREDIVVNLNNSKECDLCDLLHVRAPKETVYRDMKEWWIHKGQCRTYED